MSEINPASFDPMTFTFASAVDEKIKSTIISEESIGDLSIGGMLSDTNIGFHGTSVRTVFNLLKYGFFIPKEQYPNYYNRNYFFTIPNPVYPFATQTIPPYISLPDAKDALAAAFRYADPENDEGILYKRCVSELGGVVISIADGDNDFNGFELVSGTDPESEHVPELVFSLHRDEDGKAIKPSIEVVSGIYFTSEEGKAEVKKAIEASLGATSISYY